MRKIFILLIIVGLLIGFNVAALSDNDPDPEYIEGIAGDLLITVQPFDWSVYEGQTYEWWSQATIDDYVLNGGSLPSYDATIPVVVMDNGDWKLNAPFPEVVIPDTVFAGHWPGGWYFFYYPPYDWGRWVNSVGWLEVFAKEAIGIDPKTAGNYIYEFDPWGGGQKIDLKEVDQNVYDEYLGRKERRDGFITSNYVDDLLADLQQNYYYHDTEHIQWALDNVAPGGTVKLKGSFNFPLNWGIAAGQSVVIIGDNAIIRGGDFPILQGHFPHDPGMNITIKNLTIEGYRSIGITFVSRNGTPFGNITIDNVKLNGGIPTTHDHKEGMFFWGRRGANPPSPPLIAESIEVTNCYVDLVGEANGNPVVPYTDTDNWKAGRGISLVSRLGTPEQPINIIVKGNTIKNTSEVGINVEDISGTASIEDNFVIPGPIGVMPAGHAPGSIGIQTRQFLEFDGWGYSRDLAKYIIKNNTIEKVPTTKADGSKNRAWTFSINIAGTKGTVVQDNQMTSSQEGYTGSLIYMEIVSDASIKNNIFQGNNVESFIDMQTVSDASIKSNTLAGTCLYALISYNGSEKIRVVGNDLRNVIPSQELGADNFQLWFGRYTKNNTAVNNKFGEPGQWGGVSDSGENDLIANNTFYGNYPGWSFENIGEDGSPVEKGFIGFGRTSYNCKAVGNKSATPPHGFDICGQILDNGTNNKVPGYEKCLNHSAEFIAAMQEKLDELEERHQNAVSSRRPPAGWWKNAYKK